MTILEMYAEIETKDVELLIARFGGNQALLEKFVRKFPDDKAFEQLEAAVRESNYDAIEMEAHTLKGVSANLGFEHLSEVSAQIVNLVRTGEFESVKGAFDNLDIEYKKVIKAVGNLD